MTQIERTLNRGMTVADLIEALQACDPDARVVFGCDYGDIGHTEQALPVTTAEQIDWFNERLVESAYSSSGIAIDRIELDETTDDGPQVVILR